MRSFLVDHREKVEKWLYKNGPSPFQIQTKPEHAEEDFVSVKKAA